ncbi:hypothetical protein GCM10009544_58700 [Streptomyces stramineus]|uniref:Uncharacterized protein n=1 Tax=Streptomyces stramineus TaxID=173861 RepID=A0ABN1B649_9ACTN
MFPARDRRVCLSFYSGSSDANAKAMNELGVRASEVYVVLSHFGVPASVVTHEAGPYMRRHAIADIPALTLRDQSKIRGREAG